MPDTSDHKIAFTRGLVRAEREMKTIAEQQGPDVKLRQMTDGHIGIQDYTRTGLTRREHPIAFLRKDLAARSIVTCGEAMSARDGNWLMTADLVLVCQMPGSEKGVMFLTIEDETGPANVRLAEALRGTPARCTWIEHDGYQRPNPTGRGGRAPHSPTALRSVGATYPPWRIFKGSSNCRRVAVMGLVIPPDPTFDRCPVTVTGPHLDLCYEIGDGRGFYKLEGVRRRDDPVAEV